MLSKGYGMDVTNPDGSRWQQNAMRLGISLTLIASILLIIGHTEHAYRRLQQRQDVPRRTIQCESMSPDLGPISVNRAYIDLEELEDYAFPEVTWGGRFSPRNCNALDKVAIIVPYRDRKRQLPIFLNHIHQFLMKQQIEYGIFIIEQTSRHEYFNRAKLLNVGFVESQRQVAWKCFIFHNIDLLPLDLRNTYSCPHPKHPRHHAAAVQQLYSKLPYNTIFSGAVAMTPGQFRDVNGYSNAYWGFGGEDDDIVYRMHLMGYTIARYNLSIARYASLDHGSNPQNKNQGSRWYTLMMEAKNTLPRDGLTTLNYSLKSVVPHRLYTHIKAHIGSSPSYHQLLKTLNKFKHWQQSKGSQSEFDRLVEEFTALF